MKKPKFSEEFLWKIFEFQESLTALHEPFAPRTMRDVAAPEMRKLRLAYEQKKRKKSFSQFVSYLKTQGYIKIPEGKSISFLQLTEKGKQKALKGKKATTQWPSRKDGKMIMLMFDIPKRKQHVRHVFRESLEFLGYEMLQKSVWVSSRDVLKETGQAVREYDLGDCVNLFTIERIRVRK